MICRHIIHTQASQGNGVFYASLTRSCLATVFASDEMFVAGTPTGLAIASIANIRGRMYPVAGAEYLAFAGSGF